MAKGGIPPQFAQLGQSQGIPQRFPVQSLAQFQQSPLGQYAAGIGGGMMPGGGGFAPTPISNQVPFMPPPVMTPVPQAPPAMPVNPGGGLPLRGPGGPIPEPGLGGNGISFPDPLGGVG